MFCPFQGGSGLKIIIGTGLCLTGTLIWTTTLIGVSINIDTRIISLGVIMGGGIVTSGIMLICSPAHPVRFSYFDK
jgi:hypothetical protein